MNRFCDEEEDTEQFFGAIQIVIHIPRWDQSRSPDQSVGCVAVPVVKCYVEYPFETTYMRLTTGSDPDRIR